MKPFKAAEAYAADLQGAYAYFRQGGEGAAARFLLRYEKAIISVRANPLICRLRRNGWRQMRILRSTYAIFYRDAPDFWFLGGVISTVQDPDLIQARLLIREISPTETDQT